MIKHFRLKDAASSAGTWAVISDLQRGRTGYGLAEAVQQDRCRQNKFAARRPG